VTAAISVHVNPNLPWYIARSSGIVAWALVTASVIWGLAFSGKLTRHAKLPSPAWMLDLHRFLGGLAVVFTGFHIAGLMMDKFVGYGPAQIAVPFTGVYRPVATAWGIIGCYLLLSIELTSLLMARLPRKVWHGIHLTSFGVFTLVTVHGLWTGTDARHGILPLTMLLATIVVAMLTGMRAQIAIARRTERAARAQRAGRAAPGARPVRQPAVAMDGDARVPERPTRTLDRPRPVRQPAVAMPDGASVRARALSRGVDHPEAPARSGPARQPASARAADPVRPGPTQPRSGPHAGSGDRRSAERAGTGTNTAPPPYRRAAPNAATPTMHRVPADGRGADPRPSPVERPMAADGRGAVPRRTSADGRPLDEPELPSERVAGRLP
jgi:DMSO/TMAO reductase YedYZ heme-binding membrane subunit